MKIQIYGKVDCPWCTRAKDECFKFGKEYEYYDLFSDLSDKEFKDLFEFTAIGAKTVPIVVVDGVYIGGYSELKLKLNGAFVLGSSKKVVKNGK
jgi:glutaredoxin